MKASEEIRFEFDICRMGRGLLQRREKEREEEDEDEDAEGDEEGELRGVILE